MPTSPRQPAARKTASASSAQPKAASTAAKKTTARKTAPSRKAPRAAPGYWAASDEAAQAAAAPLPAEGAASALRVVAQSSTMSPEMKAFNRALVRIDKIKTQMADMEATCQAHQQAKQAELQPLLAQETQLIREMVLFLDGHLELKSLSKTQRKTATTLLLTLAASLASHGDAEMAELHDRRSPQTLDDIEKESAKAAAMSFQDMMEHVLGERTPDLDGMDDPEEMMRASLRHIEKLQEEDRLRREAASAARKAKRKPSAAQEQAQAAQEHADVTLKTIFRQIASRLHPDREPDEQERLRKTALMSEANAAYDRKDLVALMNIQLQAEMVDRDHASRLSAERLAALTLLLKQQAAELERERQMAQQRWMHQLNVPFGLSLQPAMLRSWLNQTLSEYNERLTHWREDLAQVQEETGFRAWLNEQTKVLKEQERAQRIGGMPFFF